MADKIPCVDVILRENWDTGRVEVHDNGRVVYSHREYRGVIEWMMLRYSFTDDQYMELYRDYKDDYDS